MQLIKPELRICLRERSIAPGWYLEDIEDEKLIPCPSLPQLNTLKWWF